MSFIKKEFTFPSVSGLADIHAASYKPENGDIRAVLQIAHGMAEHLERYEKFASYLCDLGIAVYINDHLGHGSSISSASELGFFGAKEGWKNFVEDCRKLTAVAKAENPGVPVIFFGHSMGSFVARAYTYMYPQEVKAAVYCGTAAPNPASGVGAGLSTLIAKVKGDHHRSKLIDKIAFGTYNSKFEKRTAFDWLTRDNNEVDKYVADDLCGFLFTANGYRDLMQLLGFVSSKEWFNGLDKQLPVLVIAGDMDPVGGYGKGIDTVCEKLARAGKNNLTKILYPGARHEILNEKACFDAVVKDVADFVYKNI